MTSRVFAWMLMAALATPAFSGQQLIEQLQSQYRNQGATTFTAERGKQLWEQQITNKQGEQRACTSCHGIDPRQSGQHATTKKPIKPMAMSVNSARFSDEKKINKWFTRNCKWTWGRECSPQEKGDILQYMLTL
ncbi:MAG: DUF1924 domain-containing protein [Gammaproteobacteria bacterium]